MFCSPKSSTPNGFTAAGTIVTSAPVSADDTQYGEIWCKYTIVFTGPQSAESTEPFTFFKTGPADATTPNSFIEVTAPITGVAGDVRIGNAFDWEYPDGIDVRQAVDIFHKRKGEYRADFTFTGISNTELNGIAEAVASAFPRGSWAEIVKDTAINPIKSMIVKYFAGSPNFKLSVPAVTIASLVAYTCTLSRVSGNSPRTTASSIDFLPGRDGVSIQ
jgi:hypothetical protein